MVKNNMTGGVLMKWSLDCYKSWWVYCFILCCVWPQYILSQDVIPSCALRQQVLDRIDSLPCRWQCMDTVAVPSLVLSSAFRRTATNELLDSLGMLHPFWEKLHELQLGVQTDTLHIVHVGDSHIRGHIFPRTVGERLQQTFGALHYTDMGINGAFCFSFSRPERIARIVALQPDLLILSFGTNESHNRRYNSQVHYRQLDELVRLLRKEMPHVPILMTTPPGSYESFRQRRRRRTYKVNPRTYSAVRTIRRYADDNGLAVWDMFEVFGGVQRATLNWWESGMMRPDHVHYLPEGYELQGCMLYQALLKAYNQYIVMNSGLQAANERVID